MKKVNVLKYIKKIKVGKKQKCKDSDPSKLFNSITKIPKTNL